jgi:hypothetical protein
METSRTFLTVLGKLKKKRKNFLANPIDYIVRLVTVVETIVEEIIKIIESL